MEKSNRLSAPVPTVGAGARTRVYVRVDLQLFISFCLLYVQQIELNTWTTDRRLSSYSLVSITNDNIQTHKWASTIDIGGEEVWELHLTTKSKIREVDPDPRACCNSQIRIQEFVLTQRSGTVHDNRWIWIWIWIRIIFLFSRTCLTD